MKAATTTMTTLRTTMTALSFDATNNLGWMHSWESVGVDFDKDNNNITMMMSTEMTTAMMMFVDINNNNDANNDRDDDNDKPMMTGQGMAPAVT